LSHDAVAADNAAVVNSTALVAEPRAPRSAWDDPEPIRGELLSGPRLDALAQSLAREHRLAAPTARRKRLAPRVAENCRRLLHDYRLIAAAATSATPLTPAAEWLNDNYHLVERQLQQVRDDLPRGFYLQLPRLANGPLQGYPRILSIAWALVEHTDSRIDVVEMTSFIARYQDTAPLTVGELWALATILRIVLIENLRRCAGRVVHGRASRQEADRLADHLLAADRRPLDPLAILTRHVGNSPLKQTLAVRLVQRLRDQDPTVLPAMKWLEERLAEQGQSIESIVHDEHQRQAGANVTVRNLITSLRQLATLDWTTFVEQVSLVDAGLARVGQFARMDFATRTRYREAVEELARGSHLSELEIVERVNALAASEASRAGQAAQAIRDVGYFLISAGRRQFERELGYQARRRRLLRRMLAAGGLSAYLCAITALTALALYGVVMALEPWLGAAGRAFALLALLPILDVVILITNTAYTSILRPYALPAMDLKGTVAEDSRSLLVMPILLASAGEVTAHIERLEAHYLASARGELYFALLCDFADAPAERMPADEQIRAAAVAAIHRLNERYEGGTAGARFRLVLRRRQWSDDQGRWIGWERKRGKLHELNRWLRGATDTSFDTTIPGWAPPSPGVRYVITLDADTELPPGAADRLIGKITHPLNRALFDPALARVVAGYGILQPRVTPALTHEAEGSLFHEASTGTRGLDPYVFAVSDLYQDLCGEGSYTGKGIYEVDAFEAGLEGRVPQNAVLSHDLFEGIFARAGFASDIEVVEPFPERYDVAAARQHRWVRGDWQLLPYLFRTPRLAGKRTPRDRVPTLGRWKMVDNLRRSLAAPALVLALLAGVLLPGTAGIAWVAGLLIIPTLPRLIGVLSSAIAASRSRSRLRVGEGYLAELRGAALHTLLALVLLADQAHLMLDAILRTLYRLGISHRHLLDWTTAAQVALAGRADLSAYLRRMIGGVALAAIGAAWIAVHRTPAALVLAPVSVLWLFAPAIACWASVPRKRVESEPLGTSDARTLRLIARQTWAFFERFVTPASHDLPPDNFQETPTPVVAQRTSPTNISLYLLSMLTARAFGWVGLLDMIDRLEATLGTIERLQKLRGHLYNWYDTGSLEPLEPRYVSTVDSGNLAGHLFALAQFCEVAVSAPLFAGNCLLGLSDACALAERSHQARPAETGTAAQPDRQVQQAVDRIAVLCMRDAKSAPAVLETLLEAASIARAARADTPAAEAEQAAPSFDWAGAVLRCALSHGRDVTELQNATVTAAGRAATEHGQPGAGLLPPPAVRTRLEAIAERARALAFATEFGFVFDADRQLMSVGYAVRENRRDVSYYDLLASEARLASFIAIAKGDVPTRHWFRLGRPMTRIGRGAALLSWSGSMFEYLMPALVMQAPIGSLLERTLRAVVARQQQYAAERGIPWGISESAYNVRDLGFTYQYSDFGVPGLGLKPGLAKTTVVAPYATALAAVVDPIGAVRNMGRLQGMGALGTFGFFEALDFTPSHLPQDATVAVVRAFMAHHQGMTIVAIGDALLGGLLREHFHNEPLVRAAELLLQERPPYFIAQPVMQALGPPQASMRESAVPRVRRFTSWHAATPITQLLGNGRYSVMLTTAGSGYSRCGSIALTRWREDVTCDDYGSFIYLRDVDSGRLWSSGYQPTQAEPEQYAVTYTDDRCEILRRDGSLSTVTEHLVSVEHDAEVRRVSVTNHGGRTRAIELTSYAELVLVAPETDQAHQAFAKLFVQTEYVADSGILLAKRRGRLHDEPNVWAGHLAYLEGETAEPVQYETDRARFLGRGRTPANAQAMMAGAQLSGTVGTVLDPIFSLRLRVRVLSGETVRVVFWTITAATREDVLSIAKKCRDAGAVSRAATLAWTYAQVQLRHIGVDADEANLFQRLAAHVLYASSSLRASRTVLRSNTQNATALWAHGISGDLPLVVLHIDSSEDLALVKQILRAHEYWDAKNLAVDIVIVNDIGSSYAQQLHGDLEALVRASQARARSTQAGRPGNVYAVRSTLMSSAALQALQAAARIELMSRRGTLVEQLERIEERLPSIRRRAPLPVPASAGVRAVPATQQLEQFNGLGGFAAGGREYVTVLAPGQSTPVPWINVIANPAFGFHASTDGGGYTWAENSHENALTPWGNDPVTDRSGEALYVRDDDSGAIWTATAAPIRDETAHYVAVHGAGYSKFTATVHGVAMTLVQFVPLTDSVKICRLTLQNQLPRARRLSVCAYAEWVLGSSRAAMAPFIITERCARTGALLARNPWSAEFGGRVAFLSVSGAKTAWTCDRTEFLGRYGTVARPAALQQNRPLGESCGGGLDPCAVMLATLEVPASGSAEVVVLLGQGRDLGEAQSLVERYRQANLDSVLDRVVTHWNGILGNIQVQTPDRAMDLMLNGWLLYQTRACRMWARSALYQSSGAYGFRDQLQDSMAIAVADPTTARQHLLRAAGRQFREGDVQHWWMPESGRGVRTRIADDRIWLPYVASHYVTATGDRGVLDEQVPFLEGPAIPPGTDDAYFLPTISSDSATLYEHCARALDCSLALGSHGLPLIGTGDWNDGFNLVGAAGRGESVWLGWFLATVLADFSLIAEARGDSDRVGRWRQHVLTLQESLEQSGWDGDWYRRGYFDDGTPLGSLESAECRIDAIAQSWAVISGIARPARAAHAMAAVEDHLIKPDLGLALLFEPPFVEGTPDPGYIRAYPAGIRENGGQYTHGALWSIIAFALLGDGERAAQLFSLLNPINRAARREDVERYKAEPYVVAADVYAAPGHVGRAGWTWYTGAAGWLYRAGLEWVLGVRVQGEELLIEPCIPRSWRGFEIRLQHRSATYEIAVTNPFSLNRGVSHAELDDGTLLRAPLRIPLKDDGKMHRVRVVLG
jgi:cyclic beta-1,2-glucan synthetase